MLCLKSGIARLIADSVTDYTTAMPHTNTCTDRDYSLDTWGVMKQSEGGWDGKEGKERKRIYLLCIGSVQNILATSILV
jgi:hypothetical protein